MVPISPQAYSAEAVVFDTRPLAALQQKLAAKKAAKDEALDKYFLDLKNKINPAGMRTQDLPEWNKELENWISNGVMNRKEIAKGGMAQQEYLLKYQNLLSKVEQSKQMGKFQSDLESKKQEGKIDEDDFPLLDSIRLSIYNPQHYKNTETLTPYSMGDFSENIPTWDIGKSKQFYVDFARAGAKPAEKINEKTIYNPNTRSYTTTYEEVYSLPQLTEMAIKGGAAITSDKSGYKTHKKILEEGERQIPSERFIDYAKAYSKIAPNDIMDTPEKAAAAGIVLNNSGVIDRKTETDIKREPPQIGGFGFGYGYPFGVGIEGNALDEITNVVGVKKGVVVKDGVANINGVPYSGKIVMLGNQIPESVRSPLKSIGYKFSDTEQVDVNMVDGKIESIQALGRTSSGVPAKRKSVVSRSMMENAQLKFSTEPQKGPQMQFGQGLSPKTPAFTFPGGKPIKF